MLDRKRQKALLPQLKRKTCTLLLSLCLIFLSSLSCASAAVVTPQKVEDILNAYLDSKKDELPPAKIRFKKIYLPKSFDVPNGQLSYEIYPSNQKIIGNGRFTIIFKVAGKGVVKNIPIKASVEAISPVAVAARDLKRNQVLLAEDLEMIEQDIAKLRNPCFNLQEIVGKKVTRNVRANNPINRNTVDFPPLVKRGETVLAIVRTKTLQLKVKGVARQNGKQGELIKIRNRNSRKEFSGRVIAPGIVEVMP